MLALATPAAVFLVTWQFYSSILKAPVRHSPLGDAKCGGERKQIFTERTITRGFTVNSVQEARGVQRVSPVEIVETFTTGAPRRFSFFSRG